jgi:hypothetical protein
MMPAAVFNSGCVKVGRMSSDRELYVVVPSSQSMRQVVPAPLAARLHGLAIVEPTQSQPRRLLTSPTVSATRSHLCLDLEEEDPEEELWRSRY